MVQKQYNMHAKYYFKINGFNNMLSNCRLIHQLISKQTQKHCAQHLDTSFYFYLNNLRLF